MAVSALWFFLTVPWVGLQYVIVIFLSHFVSFLVQSFLQFVETVQFFVVAEYSTLYKYALDR